MLFKGQMKPKADWRAINSPQKQTNEFVLFAPFFHSKQTIFIFWENLWRTNPVFGFIWSLALQIEPEIDSTKQLLYTYENR